MMGGNPLPCLLALCVYLFPLYFFHVETTTIFSIKPACLVSVFEWLHCSDVEHC